MMEKSMMEEHLSPLAVTHLLQHTLRSLCIHGSSQWIYAVFWRILPRNYPPPKWDGRGAYDRSRGNRRNWILVWEDGFCNFAASAAEMNYGNCEFQHYKGLQPELFFKMSHEIYSYGEGLIGKVAADHGHKWIYNEPNDEEINLLSSWQNSADSLPRPWEAQFQSGIKTIALIAVREGVVQLGAVEKVVEDLNYVVSLRKKFSYIESIPGVLLPHPSSSQFTYDDAWHHHGNTAPPPELYDHFNNTQLPFKITPSMSSLEALLSKLPSVVPPPQSGAAYGESEEDRFLSMGRSAEFTGTGKVAQEEEEEEYREREGGETSISMSSTYRKHRHNQLQQHQDLKQ